MLTFLSSWVGLVLFPIRQVGNFSQIEDPKTGEMIPPTMTDLEERGREEYISLGCVYCHSQQVHPARARTDLERGWGERRTVARDYAMQGKAQMGTMRTGPDLANIGTRNPSETWHFTHLYDPQLTSKGSNMPPFRFLFKTQKIGSNGKSDNALNFPPDYNLKDGYEVVPTERAYALLAYLQSLKLSSYAVPEAEDAKLESLKK